MEATVVLHLELTNYGGFKDKYVYNLAQTSCNFLLSPATKMDLFFKGMNIILTFNYNIYFCENFKTTNTDPLWIYKAYHSLEILRI